MFASRPTSTLRFGPSYRADELVEEICCYCHARNWHARTPRLLAARAAELGGSPEEAGPRDFAPDSPRGNAICRMVDASEVAFLAVFLASETAWAVVRRADRGDRRCRAGGVLLIRHFRAWTAIVGSVRSACIITRMQVRGEY